MDLIAEFYIVSNAFFVQRFYCTLYRISFCYSYTHTCATAVVILDPPDAPTIIFTSVPLTMMVGEMEDWGLLRGWRKLGLDGGRSSELFLNGKLKSSISSLKMMPLVGERIRLPKLWRGYGIRGYN